MTQPTAAQHSSNERLTYYRGPCSKCGPGSLDSEHWTKHVSYDGGRTGACLKCKEREFESAREQLKEVRTNLDESAAAVKDKGPDPRHPVFGPLGEQLKEGTGGAVFADHDYTAKDKDPGEQQSRNPGVTVQAPDTSEVFDVLAEARRLELLQRRLAALQLGMDGVARAASALMQLREAQEYGTAELLSALTRAVLLAALDV